MWIPGSEADLKTAVENRVLSEHAQFDAKRALPSSKRNLDIAIDVAAMANEGGVLLYGLGEDEHGGLTVLNPVPIAGVDQRIDQVVQHGIVPRIPARIRTIPTADDPSIGYVVVVVMASAHAPHMVIHSKDNRYYGRTASGNVPLNEAQVDALYARRQRTEREFVDVFERAMRRVDFPQALIGAQLDVVCWPMFSDPGLLMRAAGGEATPVMLADLIGKARDLSVYRAPSNVARRAQPALSQDFQVPTYWRQRTDGWVIRTNTEGLAQPDQQAPRGAYGSLFYELGADDDGIIHVAWGGATRQDMQGRFLLDEVTVGEIAVRAIWLAAAVYSRASYIGPVSVGVHLRPVLRSVSRHLSDMPELLLLPEFEETEYWRTMRSDPMSMSENPREIARALLQPLVRALTQGRIDLFTL